MTSRGQSAMAALAGALALLACALAAAAPAPAAPPSGVEGWAFAIGNHTLDGHAGAVGERLGRFDLVVVDGEEASPAEVGAVHSHGTVVLGYLSVGTIEKWRSWYPALKRYRLRAWQDWKDEWFADASRRGYRRAVREIAADLLEKGFDGLMLDNTDMVETRGHRRQRRGMGRLIAGLASLAHDDGRYLFTQNGAPGMLRGYPRQGVEPLWPHFDGWNREDVSWTWDFDRRRYVEVGEPARQRAADELTAVAAHGLLTTATDYVDLENASLAAECESIANAAAAGALGYVADIGLTRRAVAANPPQCS